MTATFFEAPEDFRRWLAEHHADVDELWVGYYKKGTGKPSVTWPESRDEALCWGWIDGVRKSIDDEAYKVRFTPRRPGSHWSKVNLERVAELMEEGRMAAPGRKQATWWVVSAKREETRERRLATLIDDSASGLRIKQLRRS